MYILVQLLSGPASLMKCFHENRKTAVLLFLNKLPIIYRRIFFCNFISIKFSYGFLLDYGCILMFYIFWF